jgi:predicted dehydrogenase
MMSKIKVGIIGFGKMGKIRANVISHLPELKLVGISDIEQPDNCQYLYYPKYEELINAVDAVFICTPNKYIPDIIVMALNKKKHVFSEKPMGRNMEDVQKILEAEKANKGLKLKFGFNHRYHGSVMEAKRIIDNGDLGKVLMMRGVYGKSGNDSWRNQKEIAGGGILLDQGIHMLDLLRYIGGEFESVKSFVSNLFWKTDVEDNALAILKSDKGILAAVHSSSTCWKHTFHLMIFLEKGYLILDGILSSTRSYGQGEKLVIGKKQLQGENYAIGNPQEQIIYFDKDNSWELEIKDFIDCIKNNKPVLMGNSYDAMKAMELVYKIYKDGE